MILWDFSTWWENELESGREIAIHPRGMKFSHVFLLLVMVAIGYAIYPVVHPKVMESPAAQVAELGVEKAQQEVAKIKESVAPIEKVTAPVVEEAVEEVVVEVKAPVEREESPVVEEVELAEVVDASSEEASAIRQAMKKSLVAGEVSEFSIKEVKKVTVEPSEERDGVSYEVGSVLLKKVTLFGEREEKVIALIQDGKVQKWLWMPSEMEVR
jgi:hypothetical protein